MVTKTTAVYLEDVFEATDALKLIGGLRYDRIDVERESFLGQPYFTKSYSPITGRLGLVYSLTPDANVYASYSRAAQPVSQLVSLTASQSDFSLQKGAQLEVGLKTSLWNQRGDLTVALFDIEKKDLLTSTIFENVRLNSQIGAQVSQGAEVALSIAPAAGWRSGRQRRLHMEGRVRGLQREPGHRCDLALGQDLYGHTRCRRRALHRAQLGRLVRQQRGATRRCPMGEYE